MPAMQRFAALVLLMLLGCGPGSKVADDVEEFADRACACADPACLDKVQVEYESWYGQQKGARGSERQRKRVTKALERYAKCSEKVRGNPDSAAPAP